MKFCSACFYIQNAFYDFIFLTASVKRFDHHLHINTSAWIFQFIKSSFVRFPFKLKFINLSCEWRHWPWCLRRVRLSIMIRWFFRTPWEHTFQDVGTLNTEHRNIERQGAPGGPQLPQSQLPIQTTSNRQSIQRISSAAEFTFVSRN